MQVVNAAPRALVALAVLTLSFGCAGRSTQKGTLVPGGTIPVTIDQNIPKPDDTLLAVSLTQADVRAPFRWAAGPKPDDLQQGQSLTLCGAHFPSEAARQARHQTAIVGDVGPPVVTSEAVLYGDTDQSVAAFDELVAAAAQCPPTAAPQVGATGDPLRYTFQPSPDSGWPPVASVQRLAYAYRTVDDRGATRDAIEVYLRRGRLMVAIHIDQPNLLASATTGQVGPAELSNILAGRVRDLPYEAVEE